MKKKRTLSAVAAASLTAISLSVPAAAAAETPDAASYVSIRETAVRLGAQVSWDPNQRSVTVTKEGTKLVLTIGRSTAVLNGKTVPAGGNVRITGQQAMAPAAFLSAALGGTESAEGPSEAADNADLFLQALRVGNGAEAAKVMSPALQQALPAQTLSGLLKNYESVYGQVSSVGGKQESDNAVHHNVAYTLQTAAVPLQITLRLNADRLVDDLNISPVSAGGYRPPAYDHPEAYTEREVQIGEGEWALPGMLTLPAGQGPFPAVVLVHGSGPNDRDTSIGGAKPFRDLAAGLAAKGIAVLRYDKVTFEHTFKIAANPKLTVKEETVDDALSAVKLLTQTPGVDPARIYVAGHSQGGYAMPLIVDADANAGRNIAGTILLSGPSSSFIDVAVEQQAELVSRVKQLGQDSAPYEQQAVVWTQAAKLLDDPQYSVSHLPESFPIPPAYWWYDKKDYKPAELAKTQSGPMLVLQGENDWQVPMHEFEQWKEALKGRTNVEYKSFPKVNHLLAEYDGLSTGSEYAQPSNVTPAIIDTIASWIGKQK
ncbi:alpha/beta fold hydrolase [Paenibacillus cellulositrophicus]|uniref:alpha/beta hydrolase family protein n=1 Tax=Paenibacillus cellulositrophicus TaxID=562959 RepID=UPI001267719B|nr:alpha/beta fold hydrolase [Paenibacillus cellulositrophicus]